MRTALVTIATGESYREYAKQMIDSARVFWQVSKELTFFVFTDVVSDFEGYPNAYVCHTTAKNYPNETLFRYQTILAREKELSLFDSIYYCDADMAFVAPVGDEVFNPNGIVAVRHPGYMVRNTKGDCELREASNAYCIDNTAYYAGGFQGGSSVWYAAAMYNMREAIREDFTNNITAKWHDESHWNRYIANAQKLVPGHVKELTPSYCYPEDYDGGYGWKSEEYPPILVCLNKHKRGNHPRYK